MGTNTPFDRLVEMMDHVCMARPFLEVFGQIGHGTYVPHYPHALTLDHASYQQAANEADLIVGHAGTGTIMLARQHEKPMILVPRKASLRETRNDHQSEMLRQMRRHDILQGAYAIAHDTHELQAQLERPLFDWYHPSDRKQEGGLLGALQVLASR